MKKKTLITLAAGKTGFATAKILLEKKHPVRAFVRSRSKRTTELEDKGAEVVTGNFDDEVSLREALQDVDKVYYCYPYKKGLVHDITLFIKVAKAAGVDTVVFMGQRIAEFDDTGSVLTSDIRQAYKLLHDSGLHVIYFAPGYFAENVFVVSEQVLQLGIMPNMFKAGRNPWISVEDMARCIAALLIHPEPYHGQKLFPTGPASLSSKEIVEIFSKVKGRRVWLFDIPEWLYLKAGMMGGEEYGFDAFAIVQGAFYNRQMQMNRFDIAPTNVVRELTGKDPEDFETITRRYFQASRYATRSFFAWMNAFIRFMRLPFFPIPSSRERKAINAY